MKRRSPLDGNGLPSHWPEACLVAAWVTGWAWVCTPPGWGTAGRLLHLRDHTCLRKDLRKQDLEKLTGPSVTPKPLGQSNQSPLFPHFLASALSPSPVPHHILVTMTSIHKPSLIAGPLATTHSLSPSSFVRFIASQP